MIPNTINIICYPEEKKFDCNGLVAIGEYVKLIFSAPEGFESTEGMNVKVHCKTYCCNDLLTKFPLKEDDDWTLEEGKLICDVNFNTKQLHEYAESITPFNCLSLTLELSNNKEGIETLLCSDEIKVMRWNKFPGEDPEDIGNLIKTYKDHAHTGNDGTKKISHSSLDNIGTKSHEELEREISDLSSKEETLSNKINGMIDDVSALNKTVGNTTIQFQENNNKHLEFEKNIKDIKDDLETVSNDVVNNNNNTNNSIKILNESIARLQTTVNTKADTTELDKAKETLNSHELDNNNPHEVTAAQVGAYTKSEMDKKLSAFSNAINYQGTVDTKSDLPTNANRGDLYNVKDTGLNYIWDGNVWDELSPLIDLSGYVTKEDLNNHTNNYNNPHKVTSEQIGALPTVDGVAENLKKKTATDTKTTSFSWGTGSYGAVEGTFDKDGHLNGGYVDIGGNWVLNPQENLSMYGYSSVPGLREDLYWYNVSCNDYIYPDENASDDNYDYVYNFYLGYDESNGIFVEVAFEMYVYNEETGESGYEYVVKPCHSTSWEDVFINSPVLSEYELLDDEGIIKSEKIPPYSESDPEFTSWKSGKSTAVGGGASAYAYFGIAVGDSASASGYAGIAVGKSAGADSYSIAVGNSASASGIAVAMGNDAKASNGIAIGDKAKTESGFSVAIGRGAEALANNCIQIGVGQNKVANSVNFLDYCLIEGGFIPFKTLPYGKWSTYPVSDLSDFPPNLIITHPTKNNADKLAPKIDLKYNIGAIIIGSGAKVTNTYLNNMAEGGIVIGSAIKNNNANPTDGGISSGSTEEEIAEVAPSTLSGVSIGASAQSVYGVSIGRFAKSGNYGISIGQNTQSGVYGISIGQDAFSQSGRFSWGIAIGNSSRISSTNGIAIGNKAGTDEGLTPTGGVAIGFQANIKDSKQCITVGTNAKIALSTDTSDGVAIENAVQLGTGTNSKSNSLQFLDTTLFENGKLNLDTIVLNDSVANEDGTVNKYKLKVTNGVLGVELITEEVTA